MIYQTITSLQNQTIKKVVKLGTSKTFRDTENLIVLDGVHLCQTFLEKENTDFTQLFVRSDFLRNSEFEPFKNQPQVIEVSAEVMQKISPTKSPIGLLGVGKKPNPKKQKPSKILALNGIQDPGNIGTILRSAAAFGVDKVILDFECADVWSPKVLRAGMGAHFFLEIENAKLETHIPTLGLPLYGTFLDPKAQSLYAIKFPEKWVLIVGNEGAGISYEVEKYLDHKVYIPMHDGFESLNVGVATGICLAQILK